MQKPSTPRHSLIHDDVVYFHHPEHGPLYGRVCGKPGEHGCHVEHELAGEQRYFQVPHESIVGRKQSAQRRFVIVDRGEDAAIVEDEHGERRFVVGDLPEDDDEPLQKAWGHSIEDRLSRLEALVAALQPETDHA
jgi:hypothetical protein